MALAGSGSLATELRSLCNTEDSTKLSRLRHWYTSERAFMSALDYLFTLSLSVVLVIGAYQFYFWCQRHLWRAPKQLLTPLDRWVPYRPGWVWVYSFLYYPMILALNFLIEDARQFVHVATSFLMLLILQMLCFMVLPVATPESWRALNLRRNAAERFLAVVQRFDARSNSFPSMHCSVAMLTALHLEPAIGAMAFAFPVLVATSCAYTKQHFVADLPPGLALGWAAHALYRALF